MTRMKRIPALFAGNTGGEDYRTIIMSASPAVWFRKGVGITSAAGVASAWADQSGNGRDASGSAIDLPFTGSRYLYLPGVASNFASTPDSVPASITGDIDIRVRVSLNDWSPASECALISKWTATGNQMGWTLDVTPASTLIFYVSGDGSTNASAASTAAGTFVDGTAYWIRITRVKATGATTYYQAADSDTEPTSWTQIGNAVTIAANTAFFDNTAGVNTFSINAGTGLLATGKFYRASIYSTIGGSTPVVDFNAADGTDGASSFVSSTTGETWTVNKSGALPAYLVGTSWLMSNGTSHTMATAAFVLDQPCTLFALGKDLSWTLNDYICDGAAKDSGALIQSATTPRFKVSAGSAIGENAGLAVGTLGVRCAVINGVNSLTQVNLGTPMTGDAGAAQMDGVTLFSSGAVATGFWNGMMQEYIVFPSALDETQRSRIINAMLKQYGI